ncbi:hypothetical protein OM076_22885 [Solirubrobacter ginsenosidimutans]|uniref:Uncharacterized protein n=1 Tax=Solirubrobacter ginsenosidimutans TaxID=490573 RepID=A0A9X3S741_9ACTN|nr:hypothetical protein [Solirubrobacter ginsenosidimutans]MDA0163138.1 hypothetical protein [Solirubrobacter ginsenosidimutans]
MQHLTRLAVLIFALAAGQAGVSGAHPAAERSCGLIRDDGARIGIIVQRGRVPCSTARTILPTYFRSHALCGGSSCLRKHAGWTCQTALASELPRLARCVRPGKRIAAYSTAG